MTFNKGSLILVDYTAKIKDSEEIFYTTIEEVATKHSIHDPDVKYQPSLISIGENFYPVLEGLDEALAKTSVGDKLTIEVIPEKGFGQRDPKKIRMVSMRKLGEDAEKISVGNTINVDNRTGIIRFIGSGRVQVDYNHKHAGKTILYDVNIIKLLDSPNDKISEILKTRLPVENTEISFDLKDQDVNITIPKEILRYDDIQTIKHIIQSDIFKFVPTLNKIIFVETHVNKQIQEEPSELDETSEFDDETSEITDEPSELDETSEFDDETSEITDEPSEQKTA